MSFLGNFPSATDEIGYQSELVHWCHGAGGIVYLMAKAYLVYNEEKYLISCIRMSDLIWSKGLLKKGPGLCHGIAGNGYVFLLLFRWENNKQISKFRNIIRNLFNCLLRNFGHYFLFLCKYEHFRKIEVSRQLLTDRHCYNCHLFFKNLPYFHFQDDEGPETFV